MSLSSRPPPLTSASTGAGRRRGARGEAVLVAAALCLVGWFYFFTVQTSGDLKLDVPFNYYNQLIDGFRAGHLYLPVTPDPRLVHARDPYDPAENGPYRLPDASYYRGHYYIYFGLGPAVSLMLPYTIVTGRQMPQAAAALIFCLVGVAAASGVWLALRRRFFPGSAPWLAPAGVLLLGFGAHVLALARRPDIWELPIAAGFAFSMLALAAAYAALFGRRPRLWTALAALALGLAIASRPTFLLASGLLLPPLWQLRRTRRDGCWRQCAALAFLVLALIGAGLGWYNYARFGSPFQFGQAMQLTSLREGSVQHFSARFIPYNLRVYFAWPVRWTADWPFIASRPLPPWPAGYYSGEELYWLALLSPFLWCALACVPRLWRRGAPDEAGFGAMVAAVALVCVPLAVLILSFFYAAERYMVDFTPTLMLLALCGALIVERWAQRWRGAVRTLLGTATVVTVVTGVLASFDYHGRSMKRTAPQEWNAIAAVTEPPVHDLLALVHGDFGHRRHAGSTPARR